ncbi:hypothetical protein H072_7466 [Dactylellina haptotyla CBS 200.50]|uniref:Uncharacterized protein n=1 Tax=Dactylellina haptotyla (strain CBS 200.50) TaxID=1284197 RepID=S8ACH3_DACHA|nr:hypothetical protein H072_7466 [Dactylellina haptotyla CBS 200.50]
MQISLLALATLTGSVLALPGPSPAQAAEDARVAEQLKSFEKQPFQTISWDKLPTKDYRQSDVYREVPAARIQSDGTIADPPSLIKRTPGGIYITTEFYWSGTKGYKVQPFNTCISLTSPWLRTISSFGPDAGTGCIFYQSTSCSTANGSGSIFYPGNDRLDYHNGANWNDRIGSWRCWATSSGGTSIYSPSPTQIILPSPAPTTR